MQDMFLLYTNLLFPGMAIWLEIQQRKIPLFIKILWKIF